MLGSIMMVVFLESLHHNYYKDKYIHNILYYHSSAYMQIFDCNDHVVLLALEGVYLMIYHTVLIRSLLDELKTFKSHNDDW